MSKFIQKFYKSPIIPVIRINGQINSETTLDVQNGLQQINPHLAKAIAVVINSPTGSPTQADIIIQKLTFYSKKHKLPLYTFAEEVAMSAGYYILCAGDIVYADKISQIGCIGSDPKFLGLKACESQKQYETGKKEVYKFSNEMDLWYHDDYIKLNETETNIMRQMNEQQHQKFEQYVQEQREIANLDPLQLKQKILYGEDAKKLGLVDELGNYHEVMSNLYPQANVELAQQKSTKQKIHMYMSQSLQIIKQVNQRNNKNRSKLESNLRD